MQSRQSRSGARLRIDIANRPLPRRPGDEFEYLREIGIGNETYRESPIAGKSARELLAAGRIEHSAVLHAGVYLHALLADFMIAYFTQKSNRTAEEWRKSILFVGRISSSGKKKFFKNEKRPRLGHKNAGIQKNVEERLGNAGDGEREGLTRKIELRPICEC